MPFLNGNHAESPEPNDGSKPALEPIAICGMACRLPGSIDSVSKFWEMLKEKRSVRTDSVPASRFNIDAHHHPDLSRPGSFSSRGGYFLEENLEDFDASFFNMSPVEAAWLDPQQRKMLEVCYEAFESAGLRLEDVAGSNTGVYIGSFTSDYQQMSTVERDFRHNYAATGVDVGIISNRINNTFNLQGPSFTINTACSSSVYAIHNACHALRARDCDGALAGGVNLILTVDQHMNTAKLGVLSPTSECHTFDASADGYGRAEGVGALYLKRLSDAIRDGDVIRGAILSSAVNTNGKVPGMGITFPSVAGQERVTRRAYARAGLDPEETAYLECHGTGTPSGDPIEVRAVANAMNDTRSKDRPLLLGAVKANIGHSEAASGIFAVMKAALVTERAQIPGVHGFKELNPNIKDKEWNVKINTDLITWPSEFEARRASVSSFGYGGTNAAVIVEAIETMKPFYGLAHRKDVNDDEHRLIQRPLLVTMTAHDSSTLRRNITEHQKIAADYNLPDFAYTLNCRRSRFSERAFAVTSSPDVSKSLHPDNFKYGSQPKQPVKVGMLFTGQGAQWARMGYEAIQTFHEFSETIDSLDRILQKAKPDLSWTLRETLDALPEESQMSKAERSQPVCTAIQIAIVDLFASWGIQPVITIGHSSGEIAAAYASGRMSAPQAILAAFFRGYAVQKAAPDGAMLAVGVGADDIQNHISASTAEKITIACENSPRSITLSGNSDDIRLAKEELDQAKVFARELHTGKAYHSPHMDAVASLYAELYTDAQKVLSDTDLLWRRPVVDMISSVTGQSIETVDLPINYWCDNLRGRVLFNSAIRTLGSSSNSDFQTEMALVEIGPHAVLGGPIKQIVAEYGFDQLSYTPSLVRGKDGAISLLEAAGNLFLKGIDVALNVVNLVRTQSTFPEATLHGKTANAPQYNPRYVPDLPPYQWNHNCTNWSEPRAVAETRQSRHERHDVLGRRIFGLSKNGSTWKNILRQRDVPWFQDHKLGLDVVFPAAGHFSVAIEALVQQLDLTLENIGIINFQDIKMSKALVIPDTDEGVEVHTRLQPVSSANDWYSFTIESVKDNAWIVHSTGKIRRQDNRMSSLLESSKTSEWPHSLTQLHRRVRGSRWYDLFNLVGFHYGTLMQTMNNVRTNGRDRAVAADVAVKTDCGAMTRESRYMLHPSTMDGCLHAVIAAVHHGLHKKLPWGVIPVEIEEMSIQFPALDNGLEGRCITWTDKARGRQFNQNVRLFGASGKCLMDIKNLRLMIYDAAIPATTHTEVELAEEPYQHLVWEPANFLDPIEQAEDLRTVVLSAENTPSSQELAATLHAESAFLGSGALDSFERIVVDDVGGRLVADSAPQMFEAIKSVLNSGKSIIWLSHGANSGEQSQAGIAHGFLRAVRSEIVSSRIALIDADLRISVDEIAAAVEDQFCQNTSKDSGNDVEFWLREDGSLHVARIVPNKSLSQRFHSRQDADLTTLDVNKALGKGQLIDDELIFESEPKDMSSVLRAEEIEIIPSFVKMDKDDLSKIGASHPRLAIGRITRIGAKIPDSNLLGQRVVAFVDGLFGTRLRVTSFTKIGDELHGAQTTATFAILCELVYAIVHLGKADRKASIIGITDSNPFRNALDFLGTIYGFHVRHSGTAGVDLQNTFADLGSRSVIVIADAFSPATLQSWRQLGRGSQLIVVGSTQSGLPQVDVMPFSKGATLSMCDLNTLCEENPALLSGVLKTVADFCRSSPCPPLTEPTIIDVGALLNLEEARAGIQREAELVLKYEYGSSPIKVCGNAECSFLPAIAAQANNQYQVHKSRKEVHFAAGNAYILSGCLGGLGRSLTTWMLEKGCRDFVFLSRSGATKPEAAEVVSKLERAGASVQVYKADAGDADTVAAIVKDVSRSRPIRGVIHAAMVLQDGLYANMTAEKYSAVLRPKMQGALALQHALGDTPLDFFIMTSSLSAVLGNPGQSNYCAANSFLDFLALQRLRRGQAACSIALPMVEDVGVVAENASIAESLTRKNPFAIDEQDMLKAFEAAILQGSAPESLDEQQALNIGHAQLILGLEPKVIVAGMERADMSDAYWLNDARMNYIRKAIDERLSAENQVSGNAGGGAPKSSFVASLAGLDEPVSPIAQHIINRAARILGHPPEKFSMEGASIASHGIDSMIGVELQTWLYKELKLEVSVQLLSDPSTTFMALAKTAATNLGLVASPVPSCTDPK